MSQKRLTRFSIEDTTMPTSSLLMSKVVDISTARRRRAQREKHMKTSGHDKRKELRRASNERLFVQIVKSHDQELVGTTISCRALDVSASGLRIQASTLIPTGCQLDLWVDNSAGPGKFFLSSEVRWARILDGGCEAGVELHDGAATDIAEWRHLQTF